MRITELVTRLFRNLETYGDIDVLISDEVGYREASPWKIELICNKEFECKGCPYPHCMEGKEEALII